MAAPSDHEQEVLEWQRKRREACLDPEGWLTLIGLHWLKVGENTIGKGSEKVVSFDSVNAAEDLGSLTLTDNGSVSYAPSPPPAGRPLVDGKEIGEKEIVQVATDEKGATPTQFRFSSLLWFVIKRGDSFYVRVKDRESPVLKNFQGLDYFPFDPSFRVVAHFEPFENPISKILTTSIGEEKVTVYGKYVFSIHGNEHSLITTEVSSSRSMLMFSDLTNRKTTYGGGRYVWVDAVDADGNTVLDFNKSYNPPCIFTDHATCSRPPPENKLNVEVNAGEKKWEGGHH